MPKKSLFHLVLYAPEIPGNTGSIGRTCLGLNLKLHLIKPYGFDLSEKAVRRAGLDYWKHVDLSEYDSWEDFLKRQRPKAEDLFFFSKHAKNDVFHATFKRNAFLVFGAETSGLPRDIHENYPTRLFKLPVLSDAIRSYNLSNAASAAAFEAYRQISY